jgi:hypothetical protein
VNILSIKAYCYSEETAFQDDVPGTPIEAGRAYQVEEDELIPEFNLGKAVINYMDVNPDNWFSSQEIFVNDTQALLVNFDGREFYVPYTIHEFRELLQNCGKNSCISNDKNDQALNEFYIGVGITQVLQALEREFGETDNPAAMLVRKMYAAQSNKIQNIK